MIAIDWKMPLDLDMARTRFLERGPWIMCLVFTVLIAFQLAGLTWKFIPEPEFGSIPSRPQDLLKRKLIAKAGAPPKLVAREIVKLHLFGTVDDTPVSPMDIPKEVTVSLSRLKLRGVMATNIPGEALAVIEDGGKADYYTVGDPLPDGATLVQVFSNKVIIERNGRYESLQLPEDDEVPIQEVSMNTNVSPTPSSMNRINSRETRKLLGGYRRTLKTNPQSLMNLVRASPVSVGGKLKGYRIRPGRDPGLFRKFGLRAGDVVTGINGVSLDDPFKGLEIIRDLRSSSSNELTIDVLRNGVSQSMSYGIGE